VADTQQGET